MERNTCFIGLIAGDRYVQVFRQGCSLKFFNQCIDLIGCINKIFTTSLFYVKCDYVFTKKAGITLLLFKGIFDFSDVPKVN